MPRSRLNSLSAPKNKTKIESVFKQRPEHHVVCPGCHGEVEVVQGFKFKRRCRLIVCDFRYGWVLRPTSETDHVLQLENKTTVDIKKVVAVPLSSDGQELWPRQRPWPPKLEPAIEGADEPEETILAR